MAFIVRTFYMDNSDLNWHADGVQNAIFSFPSPKVLRARGFLGDKVEKLSRANITMQWAEFDWVWKWLKLAKDTSLPQSPYQIPWRRAFFSAIVADSFGFGPSRPRFISEAKEKQFFARAEGFMPFMRCLALSKVRAHLVHHVKDQLPEELPINGDCSKYLDDLQKFQTLDDEVSYWAQNSSVTSDVDLRRDCLSSFCCNEHSLYHLEWPYEEYGYELRSRRFHDMALNLRASSAETSFFVSRQGYMGLLPFAAEEGDYICILYGCAVPLIVRPTSSGTILIGEAYVYGMMCGEMIEKVNGKEFQEEDFSFV